MKKIIYVLAFLYSSGLLVLAQAAPNSTGGRDRLHSLLDEISEKQRELAGLLSLRRNEAKDVSDILDIVELAAREYNSPRDQLMGTICFILTRKPGALLSLDSAHLAQLGECVSSRTSGGRLLCAMIVDDHIVTVSGNAYRFEQRYYDMLGSYQSDYANILSAEVHRAQQTAMALAFLKNIKQ